MWKHVDGQKRHTQDGSQLVSLMKGIGLGRRPVFAIDVGCGDGVIAHDMLRLGKATHVVAFDVSELAVRAALHNLHQQIKDRKAEVHHTSARKFFGQKNQWDIIDRFVINPPFFTAGSGRANKNSRDQLARHDYKLPLKLWAQGARKLLKTGGELYCVFPTERLAELLSELSGQKVEPKEIWWLRDDRRKRRFFLRAVRGARPGLAVHMDYPPIS